eukprot:316176_1
MYGTCPKEYYIQNWTCNETYYQNITHPDGTIERIMSTRKRHCCCHPCGISIWLFIIMTACVALIYFEKHGFIRYQTWDKVECTVVAVDDYNYYNYEISCTTYTYYFELNDNSNSYSKNHCSEFEYADDSCRDQPLYDESDTRLCYFNPNDNQQTDCNVNKEFAENYKSEFYWFIGGIILLCATIILFIYLIIGCIKYQKRFSLIWLCHWLEQRNAIKINSAHIQLDLQKELVQNEAIAISHEQLSVEGVQIEAQ